MIRKRSPRRRRREKKPKVDRCDRWNYLQAGISRIMHELEHGIDLQSVSTAELLASVAPRISNQSWLTVCYSTWEFTRACRAQISLGCPLFRPPC